MEDKKPPSIVRRYIWYILSFGVSVGLGLAPFLGLKRVKGFQALLDLFPLQLQETLIPLSMFLMGLVGIAVHFFAGGKVKTSSLNRWFLLGFAAMLVTLLMFLALYTEFVVRVEAPAIERSVAVLVGWSYDEYCDCKKLHLGEELCIRRLSFRRAAIANCWGRGQIKLTELLLSLPYLLLMGGFGGLIGIIIVREQMVLRSKHKHGTERPKKGKVHPQKSSTLSSPDESAHPTPSNSPRRRRGPPRTGGRARS